MKQIIKLGALIIFVLSALAIIWVNTGGHIEAGYTYCDGSGFIPQSSLKAGPGSLNGICLGKSTTGRVGRYDNKVTLNEIFGTVAIFSFLSYFSLRIKKTSTKH